MKQKYNWDKLELEFLKSSFNEVKPFFEYKYRTYTGHIREKTSGWTRGKKMMLQRAKMNAKIKVENQLEELYAPTMKEITQMHKATIRLIQFKLQKMHQNVYKDKNGNVILLENIDVREVEKMWKIIKEELKAFNGIYIKKDENPLKNRLEEIKREKKEMIKN